MAAVASSNRNPSDRNADATLHVGQLDDKVTDALLWELMVQAGPVRNVYIPRDRISGAHYGYGFCEFHTALDAMYALKILNMVSLFSKPLRLSQSTLDRRSQDVGANLFVGNLVDAVSEKLLHDAFSAFGPVVDAPYIMRDAVSQQSKRYGFVKFASFASADAAIAAMDGQYICNAPISVQYAYKKDGHARERHGSHAERLLAASAAESAAANSSRHPLLLPHTLFADKPASAAPPAHPAHPPAPMHMPPPQQHAYPYPPQTHAQHMPQWQRAAYPPQPPAVPPQGYHYQQSPGPPQGYHVAPTTQLGWTPKRPYANGPPPAASFQPHAQPHMPPHAPYGVSQAAMAQQGPPAAMMPQGGTPTLVADEGAPPPPPPKT